MAKSFAARFRIEPGKRAHLGRRDPADLKAFPDREAAEEQSVKDGEAIDKLQDRLYAEGKRAVLVVLQGTDTAGKDGTIKHVFKETGALGVIVTPFKQPSEEELAHDFLWRAHLAAPRRGFIGIFNRSHYEDVLVGRVRKLAPKDEIKKRYDQINAFEKILAENGTRSSNSCCTSPRKSSANACRPGSTSRRAAGSSIPPTSTTASSGTSSMAAYELMLDKCSTAWAPWHVIPADHKWARNAAIAAIVRETLEEMNPQYPKPAWDPKSFVIK